MKRLFLLEDDLSLINGLSFALKKQGYEITVARTALEADALWKRGEYDLAVLDVSLPDGSGFDFCKKIRQTSKAPIMFLTAADEETDIIMGLDIGGDDYITKPFKLAVLLMGFEVRNAAVYTIVCFLLMSAAILVICYGYFREQHKIMEHAIIQITEYISGNKEVTIECNDEGELYRLFHEVNSLVAILNAHAENEKNAKKFLKNTISDISHQLKTPLAALNIYMGLIQDEAEELPTIQEFSRLSEQELDRIEGLVQNLLKITKLDAGMIVLEKSLENVSEMAESVKKHFLFRASQEGKEICLSGSGETAFLCDRSWMIEAISNLVKNALDHTKEGDCIRMDWWVSASILQITIKDNGSGIYPEDLHHIFKRFYRSRYSKDTQGIGLGLPLAKAIVEAHNGTIEVDSTLGRGTSFTMNFLI